MDKIFDRLGTTDLFSLGLRLNELIHPLGLSIPHSYRITVTLNIEGEILSHHPQSEHSKFSYADLCLCL